MKTITLKLEAYLTQSIAEKNFRTNENKIHNVNFVLRLKVEKYFLQQQQEKKVKQVCRCVCALG